MNFESIEVVVDRLISTFKLKEWEHELEDFVEDAAEAMKLIGAAKVFAVRTCASKVENNTARLPKDLEHVKSIVPDIPYSSSGGFLTLNLPDGAEVEITYQAMPVDERGYPLIPDNAAVRQAVMWFLAKNLVLGGVIKTVNFGYAEQEWQWRCRSARAELNVMNINAWHKVQQDFVSLNNKSTSPDPNIRFILNREKNRL